jgi:hypothetical protein
VTVPRHRALYWKGSSAHTVVLFTPVFELSRETKAELVVIVVKTFGDWLKAFVATLEREHWIRKGSPPVFPYGWPNRQLM